MVMLRFFPHATMRSGFLSLLTSPVITLPGPAGTEIGEPVAGVNDDCCASTLLAFPDWHEAKSMVVTRSNIEWLIMPGFLCITVTGIEGQSLDAWHIIFLPSVRTI
jgi:hypothetical protein